MYGVTLLMAVFAGCRIFDMLSLFYIVFVMTQAFSVCDHTIDGCLIVLVADHSD